MLKNVPNLISWKVTVIKYGKKILLSTILWKPPVISHSCKSEPIPRSFSISFYVKFIVITICSRSLYLLDFKTSDLRFLNEYSSRSDKSNEIDPTSKLRLFFQIQLHVIRDHLKLYVLLSFLFFSWLQHQSNNQQWKMKI